MLWFPIQFYAAFTKGFSQKRESDIYAIPLNFVFYNLCRIHKTLRMSPAMAAGISDKLMTMDDVVGMMDAAAPMPRRPKIYKSDLRYDGGLQDYVPERVDLYWPGSLWQH